MGSALMPADEDRLFVALRLVQGQMSDLRDDLQSLRESSTEEHRKVHDIVVAMSESVRNLARLVDEMKPLTDDYREKRAEARGAAKFATALWVAVGGFIMFAVTKLSDLFTTRPHPIIIALLLVLSTSQALARDDGRYAQAPLNGWFSQLRSGKGLCCDGADGKRVNDVDYDRDATGYRVRLDGQWVRVPDDAIVDVPNRAGFAMVWPYTDADGKVTIRCFMPGALG